jgi:hypothetical protein
MPLDDLSEGMVQPPHRERHQARGRALPGVHRTFRKQDVTYHPMHCERSRHETHRHSSRSRLCVLLLR